MKYPIFNILTILFFGVNFLLNAQTTNPIDTVKKLPDLIKISSTTKWEEVKNENGIKIYYRDISKENLFSTREIKVNLLVGSDLNNFLNHLKNDEKHLTWNKGMKSIKTYEKKDSSWISKLVYDIPFPLNKQDLIVQNKIEKNNGNTMVHIYSIPNYLPQEKKIDRIKHYLGCWELKETTSGLFITYRAITISKSFIPKFLKDPLIQNNLMKSFNNLKNMVEISEVVN
ncbi:MAG: hypothetical protein ACPG6V_06700 [Flavobacteriales bacterium]